MPQYTQKTFRTEVQSSQLIQIKLRFPFSFLSYSSVIIYFKLFHRRNTCLVNIF
jgi:hypothetical protein